MTDAGPPREFVGGTSGLSGKLVAGGLSGLLGGTLTYPLDVIKTQLQRSGCGWRAALRETYAGGGLRGFFRGYGALSLGITPEKAIKIGVNDYAMEMFRRRQNRRDLGLGSVVISGTIAGLAQIIVTTPMERVKIILQTSALGERTSAVQTFRKLSIAECYRGIAATALRDVPFAVFYFCGYHGLRQTFSKRAPWLHDSAAALGAGMISGVVASGALTPADVIKTRVQASAEGQAITVRQAAAEIARAGPRAFYRGAASRMAILGPMFGISFAAFELQKMFFGV